MIYLFLFGSCVEDFLGRWQYVVFYLLGGLAASLVQFGVTSPGADALVPVVGASGAITACIGGFVPLLLKSKINFQYIALLFFRFYSGNFWLPAWLVISFWFLSDVFWAVRSYQNPQGGGGVAFAAHVGGFLAGLAMIAGWKFFIGPHQQPVEENSADPVAAGGTAALGAGHGGAEKASIFLFQNEQQVGPYTRSQIHEMLQAGSIPEDAVYWYEGMADWQGIGRFSGR